MKIDLETGAREGIERICEAYGLLLRVTSLPAILELQIALLAAGF